MLKKLPKPLTIPFKRSLATWSWHLKKNLRQKRLILPPGLVKFILAK